jgi:methylmalonyl-CoA mutase cobalamin-binding subunit
MPAAQTWQDFQEVIFQGPVVAASYAPAGAFLDVTQQVKTLQAQGRNHITGGIHTAVGDPAPGQPKQFRVWYQTTPNQTWQDFQEVQFAGQVIAASYAPAGTFLDVTQQVKGLQAQGRNHITGGIHTAIGDPAPGQPKVFTVWYA